MGKLFLLCTFDNTGSENSKPQAEETAATGRLAKNEHDRAFNFEAWARDDPAAMAHLKSFFVGHGSQRPHNCANVPAAQLSHAIMSVCGDAAKLPAEADASTHEVMVRELSRVVRDDRGTAIIVAPPAVHRQIVGYLNTRRLRGNETLTELGPGDLAVVSFGIVVSDITQLLTAPSAVQTT